MSTNFSRGRDISFPFSRSTPVDALPVRLVTGGDTACIEELRQPAEALRKMLAPLAVPAPDIYGYSVG